MPMPSPPPPRIPRHTHAPLVVLSPQHEDTLSKHYNSRRLQRTRELLLARKKAMLSQILLTLAPDPKVPLRKRCLLPCASWVPVAQCAPTRTLAHTQHVVQRPVQTWPERGPWRVRVACMQWDRGGGPGACLCGGWSMLAAHTPAARPALMFVLGRLWSWWGTCSRAPALPKAGPAPPS